MLMLCRIKSSVLYANGYSYDIELMVDTGSSITIIPENTYQILFTTCDLAEPTVTLLTYSREKTSVKGCMHATVTHDGHSTTGSFVLIKSGTALLGLHLIVALHMCIEGAKSLLLPALMTLLLYRGHKDLGTGY